MPQRSAVDTQEKIVHKMWEHQSGASEVKAERHDKAEVNQMLQEANELKTIMPAWEHQPNAERWTDPQTESRYQILGGRNVFGPLRLRAEKTSH